MLLDFILLVGTTSTAMAALEEKGGIDSLEGEGQVLSTHRLGKC